MAEGKRTLKVILAGDASALQRVFKKGGAAAGSFGSGLAKVSKGAVLGLAAIGVAGLAIGTVLFNVGETFDQASDTIQVGTGAVGEDLADLEDSFKNVFAAVPSDAESVATAIADVNTRLGLTGEELETTSAKFLDLSRVTGTDVADNIAGMSRVFGDWSISTDLQSEAMDKMFVASQTTGIGLGELEDLVVQFGAPLRNMGFGFEDSIALFSKFEKEGVNTEAVMAGMRAGLSKMALAGEEPIEAFQRVTDEIMNAGTAGEANAIALEAFGSRAGPDMAAAIREGRFEIEDLLGVMEDSEGAIATSAAETESFGEKWQRIKNRVFVGLEPLATRVFDSMGDLMDQVSEKAGPVLEALGEHMPQIMEAVSRVWERVSTMIGQRVDLIVGVISVLVARGMELWDEFGADITAAVEEIFAFADEMWPKIAAIVVTAAEQIGEIIATTVEIALALWEEFGDDIMAFIKVVWPYVETVITETLNAIQAVMDIVLGVIKGDWDDVWQGMQDLVEAVFGIIEALVHIWIESVKAVLTGLKDWFTGAGASLWDGFKEMAGDAVDEVLGFFTGLPGMIEDLLPVILSAGMSVGSAILDGIASGVSGAAGFIGDFAAGIGNAVIGWINESVIDKINTAIPDKINLRGLPDINLPDNPIPPITALASGSVANPNSPFLAMLGDNTREHEVISPVSLMREALGAELDKHRGTAPGGNQEIHVHMHGASPIDLLDERQITTAMRRTLLTAGLAR